MHDDPRIPEAPADWSAAFARLPLEQAPPGGWEALQARLPATDAPASRSAAGLRRRRWMLAAAIAAVAATSAGLLWQPSGGPAPARVATRNAVSPSIERPRVPADRSAIDEVAAGPAPGASGVLRKDEDAERSAARVAVTPARQRVAPDDALEPSRPARTAHATGRSAAPAPLHPPAPDDALVADTDAGPAVAAGATDGATPALDTLRAESRRLEAVLAAMRDEQASSATAIVLAASVDERIGLIDAALAQAGDPAEQADLWRERVVALQELAGLQGTRRWLAVHGRTLDGALTRVD